MIITAHGLATDPGRRRPVNEDAALAGPPVHLVADGMGGRAGGALAGRLVVNAFRALAGHEGLAPSAVPAAVERANAAIVRHVDADPTAQGMGATVACLCEVSVEGRPAWLVAHVGDSRVYRFADGVLEQVTSDHSLVQMLLDAGEIDAEHARRHPYRHVVSAALGVEPAPTPTVQVREPHAGERWLLCTDGLHSEVDDATIAAVLADAEEPERVALRLVNAALAAGGHDNVTVLVVDTLAIEATCDR